MRVRCNIPGAPNFPVPFIFRCGSGTRACLGADHAVVSEIVARRKNRLAVKFDPSPADQCRSRHPTVRGGAAPPVLARECP